MTTTLYAPLEHTALPQAPHSAVAADGFKQVFRRHPGGVAVITADAGFGPVGLTATSVVSVSADPPMLAFSVSEHSSSTPTILLSDTVVVHLLDARQLHLAKLCATSGIDRFADTSTWSRMESGEPYFPEAQARIRGRIVSRVPAGGSSVVILEALDSHVADGAADRADDGPLVYHNRSWHVLGEHSMAR